MCATLSPEQQEQMRILQLKNYGITTCVISTVDIILVLLCVLVSF